MRNVILLFLLIVGWTTTVIIRKTIWQLTTKRRVLFFR